MEKGSPSPSRSPIPAENVYSGRYGTSPPPGARPAILPGRARSGKGQAAKTPQPVRYLFQVTEHGWQCGGPEILKRKNGRLIEEGFCLPCSATQKQPLEKQAEGGSGPLHQRAAKDGGGCAGRFFQQERHAEKAGRARHTGRHGPDEKAFPFLRKKQPSKNRETGIREKARVPDRPSGT